MNIKSIFAVAFMATALVGTTFTLASCEDDEKPETTQSVEVNGTYNTTLNVGVGAGDKIMSLASVKDQKVVVVSLNGNNTTLTISGYEADITGTHYKHIAQKQYMLKNVKATKLADGTVKLTGQEEVTMPLRLVRVSEEKANVEYKDYKATVKTEGTIKNGKLELTNSFTPGRMPFPIVYTYTGQK